MHQPGYFKISRTDVENKMCQSLSGATLCRPCHTLLQLWKVPLKSTVFRISMLAYCGTLFLFLPLILRDVKHSMFYKVSSEEKQQLLLQQDNNLRIQEANSFFSEFINVTDKLSKAVDHSQLVYDISVSVITVSRNRIMTHPRYEPKYLTQTVGKLLFLLQNYLKSEPKTGLKNISMFVCNVDSIVSSYREAKELERFVPIVNRFDKRHLSIVHPLEKEKEDYLFCLNKSVHYYPAKYHLMIEDDAFPKDDMFKVLHHIIETQFDFKTRRGTLFTARNDALFVKLYHPERLLNYSSLEIQRLLELISISSILTTLTVLAINFIFNIGTKRLAVWIIVLVYFVCSLLEIGRVNVNQFRHLFSPYLYFLSPAPSCCTPAILYPNNTVHKVISYLTDMHCNHNFGKDSILDRLISEEKMPAYLVEPNSFQHIGALSAIRSAVVNSQFV